ncbi:hypothetical protein L0F63_005693 [Massospora cicadina]|nr:hypothetical protein L0F63_005693 [Massospora cicadina]
MLLGDFAFRMLTRDFDPISSQFLDGSSMGALRSFCVVLISTTNSPQNVVIASVAYLNRLRLNHGGWLASQNFGLTFTVCLMLASKFVEDAPYLAHSWSKASGFAPHCINRMERLILEKFDYHLLVTESVVRGYLTQAKHFYISKSADLQRRAMVSLSLTRMAEILRVPTPDRPTPLM